MSRLAHLHYHAQNAPMISWGRPHVLHKHLLWMHHLLLKASEKSIHNQQHFSTYFKQGSGALCKFQKPVIKEITCTKRQQDKVLS